MKLFEATNEYYGESYVRAYVWASDEAEALALARKAFEASARKKPAYDKRYWENVEVEELFAVDSTPFCTNPSDSGWER